MIVQGLSLLPQATAAENVEVPLLLEGIGQAEIEADAARIAESLPQRTITNDGGSGNRTPIDSAVEAMKKRREQIKGSYKM